ncbi:MAG: hypothetical protein WC841_03355 [Candidatus Shapirobacteria bacterium]
MKDNLLVKCKELIRAYKNGLLGICTMPEDSNPGFDEDDGELRLAYFTLPMSLNYQRDSYKLWEAALKAYKDKAVQNIFDVKSVSEMSSEELRSKLLKYKVALQPNKHINTWKTISETILNNWGSFKNLFESTNFDLEIIKELIQKKYKRGFPYLSGPKIFNYWSFIIGTYGRIPLKNRQLIEIAPDTHVIKCSVALGLISIAEAERLSRDEISKRWRDALEGSGISPIEMHPPLWFWSRNGFVYKLRN